MSVIFCVSVEPYLPYKSPIRQGITLDQQSDIPRGTVPQPASAAALYAPGQQVADISVINKTPGGGYSVFLIYSL